MTYHNTKWNRFGIWLEINGPLCVVGLLVMMPVLAGIAWIFINDIGGANGSCACYVIAVEDRDNLTWDSTVVHVKTDPLASNEDKYCVTDPVVRMDLERAARDRRRVLLRYQNDLIVWRWKCNGGDSIITAVFEAEGDRP